MKRIKVLSLIVTLFVITFLFSACGKQLLAQSQIEDRLLRIISDATVTDIALIDSNGDAPYYEGHMSNSYAEYYFKLDGYSGKTLDWERTIKYLSEDEIKDALTQKYNSAVIDSLTLEVDSEGSRYYTGVIFNKISYYSFKIDAFDASNVIEWEDVTAEYASADDTSTKKQTDKNNVEFCGEYTVRLKLKNIFPTMLMNSCDLVTDERGNNIYTGQVSTDIGVYTFTADAYTGNIINYVIK